MAYEIKLYYNTGFNPSNVPDSPDLIQSVGSGTFEGTPLLQNRQLGVVDIKVDDYNAIKNADYLQVGDIFYFILNISMLSPTTARLTVQEDIIGSIGLANISIIGGWCSRRHYTGDEDVFGANTLDEPFTPAEPPVIDYAQNIFQFSTGTIPVVISTVNLVTVQNIGDEYVSESGNAVVVPKLDAPKGSAEIQMVTPTGTFSYNLPSQIMYNGDNIQAELSAVRSLGVESAITGSYLLPTGLCTLMSGSTPDTKAIAGVTSAYFTKPIPNISAFYGTVENKKALALYSQLMLISLASGNIGEYSITDVASNPQIPVTVWADPSPKGSTYCRPTYYKSNVTNIWEGAVRGGDWQNNQLTFYGASGSTINQKMLNMDLSFKNINTQAQNAYNLTRFQQQATSQGLDSLKVATDIGTLPSEILVGDKNPVGTVLSRATNVVNYSVNAEALVNEYYYNLAQSGREFAQAAISATQTFNNNWLATQVLFPYAPSLQSYFQNDYNAAHVHMSLNDLKRLDLFLHRYGYSVNEPFQKSFMTNKPAFNFVKCSDIHVQTGRGVYYNTAVEGILSGGVRIWHKLPSATAMEIGGNG